MLFEQLAPRRVVFDALDDMTAENSMDPRP